MENKAEWSIEKNIEFFSVLYKYAVRHTKCSKLSAIEQYKCFVCKKEFPNYIRFQLELLSSALPSSTVHEFEMIHAFLGSHSGAHSLFPDDLVQP